MLKILKLKFARGSIIHRIGTHQVNGELFRYYVLILRGFWFWFCTKSFLDLTNDVQHREISLLLGSSWAPELRFPGSHMLHDLEKAAFREM